LDNPVVIVGGGSGAFHAVESLREHGFKGPITMLTKERYAPIDRTKLSKALVTDASKLEWRNAADLRIKYGTTLRTSVEVNKIDFASKTVYFDDGKETAQYGTLILASGSTPRRLPIEGVDLANVFTLRGVDDAQRIDAACQEGKRLVVIGSSFIGMELVVAVAKRKLASIDVVSMENVPFEKVRALLAITSE
jgi:apoptosis-inducing factor 3